MSNAAPSFVVKILAATVLLFAGCSNQIEGLTVVDGGNHLGRVDGVDALDVTGNGLLDILAGNEPGKIAWYEQTEHGVFVRHQIWPDAIAGAKQEGAVWIDIDGDGHPEIVRADQRRGEISVFKMATPGSPKGIWLRAVIKTGRPNLQNVSAIDLDGDGRKEIVYTWEGSQAGEGGINWLDWQSGDVLQPGNYNDHVIVQRSGGWWLGGTGDFSKNGHGLDMAFSARSMRNPGAQPGIFWLEKPPIVTSPWKVHEIFTSKDDWTQIEIGDFLGHGVKTDIAAIKGPKSGDSRIHFFDSMNAWAHSEVPAGHDTRFNVKHAGYRKNGRDALFVCGDGVASIFEWSGSQWFKIRAFSWSRLKVDSRVPIIPLNKHGAIGLVLFDSINERMSVWDISSPEHGKTVR